MGKPNKNSKFKVKKITQFSNLTEGKESELPESDLVFQNNDAIVQFDYVKGNGDQKKVIKPGAYLLSATNDGIEPMETELQDRDLLDEVISTESIITEARTFFQKLHVYDKINRPKKRGVLLYSDPGMGKSSAIAKFCNTAIEEDSGTVVFVWPTSKIDSDDIAHFLSVNSKFTNKCTRLIFVIEDIGGGESENGGRSRGVDSGLLNLLDGLEVTFKLPTFIIATTNYPENLLKELANRPGRFDLMLKLQPPSADERVALAEFISKEKLNAEDKAALKHKQCNTFSIAHIEEAVIRSMLHDKTIKTVISELVEHTKKFNKDFSDKGNATLGFGAP